MFALFLQIKIPPNFIFEGIKPDFLLIIVVVISLNYGVNKGAFYGLLAGLFQDLFMTGFFGVFTIIKVFIASLTGFVEGVVFKDFIIISPIIIFLATILNESLIILLSENILFNINYFNVLKSIILPASLVNAIIGLIIYYIYYKIDVDGGSNHG
ncbi:rod shape-determining protein MreD [Halanaerobiaceae bacterium ANBcell28]